MTVAPGHSLPACLEVGAKRVFASALEWPGWCRSAKGEEAALEALAAYAPRYAIVAGEAGADFDPAVAAGDFDVVERLPGSGATDFGVPDKVAAYEAQRLGEGEAARFAALVSASWAVFDRVVAGAPQALRKGPRGGGRDRDAVVAHVLGAEASYARALGIRHRPPDPDDTAAVHALRAAITDVLGVPGDGAALTPKGWPPRYAARRIAWHVLDHAWEVEDRSG